MHDTNHIAHRAFFNETLKNNNALCACHALTIYFLIVRETVFQKIPVPMDLWAFTRQQAHSYRIALFFTNSWPFDG